jgi:hypothetical protein
MIYFNLLPTTYDLISINSMSTLNLSLLTEALNTNIYL